MTKKRWALLGLVISIIFTFGSLSNCHHINDPWYQQNHDFSKDIIFGIVALFFAIKCLLIIRREDKKELIKEAIKESYDSIMQTRILCEGCNYPDNLINAKKMYKMWTPT